MQSRAMSVGVFATALLVALAGCTSPPAGNGGTNGGGGSTTPATKLTCGTAAAEFLQGGVPALAAPAPVAPGAPAALPAVAAVQQQDQGLVIGTLLPLTGALAAYGPDMELATKLAAEQINAAGGVNGKDVRLVHQDDKSTDQAAAPQTFQLLVNEGASAVVGGAASSITGAVLDNAVTSKVVVVTPASTSPTLTLERDNKGYFVRVPPSDALQGKVLAKVVYDDGCRTVSILAVNNAYGIGLGTVFEQTFKGLGGTIKSTTRFDENAQSFSSETQKAGGDNSDAVVVIGYPGQVTPIMKEAYLRGLMVKSVFFFSEGVKDAKFITDTGKGAGNKYILEGLRGTAPGSVTSPGFARFNATFSEKHGHAPGLFASESYDAVWMIALAAQCGGANTGDAIKANILKVANRDTPADVAIGGGNATLALTTARAPLCAVNYQGAAHDFDFDAKGDPKEGVYTVWRVNAAGGFDTVQENVRP